MIELFFSMNNIFFLAVASTQIYIDVDYLNACAMYLIQLHAFCCIEIAFEATSYWRSALKCNHMNAVSGMAQLIDFNVQQNHE